MSKKSKKLAKEAARLRALYGASGAMPTPTAPVQSAAPVSTSAPTVAPMATAAEIVPEAVKAQSFTDILRGELFYLLGIVIFNLALLFALSYFILDTSAGGALLRFLRI